MCLGALQGEHSLKVARSARTVQGFPSSVNKAPYRLAAHFCWGRRGGGVRVEVPLIAFGFDIPPPPPRDISAVGPTHQVCCARAVSGDQCVTRRYPFFCCLPRLCPLSLEVRGCFISLNCETRPTHRIAFRGKTIDARSATISSLSEAMATTLQIWLRRMGGGGRATRTICPARWAGYDGCLARGRAALLF